MESIHINKVESVFTVSIDDNHIANVSKYIKQHTKILDPFHGSGTALYEAATISNNVSLVGYDINPFANLITKVKMQGVDLLHIEENIKHLIEFLNQNNEVEAHNFHNATKWFREDIIKDLTKARTAIMQIENAQNRLYFWYVLSDIIRKHSNTRSSTYKLHSKKAEDISRMQNQVIETFLGNAKTHYKKFSNNYGNFQLKKGNSLELLKENSDNEFDICITSPPYGDNATTVTYGQFSMLSLYWIDRKDLNLEDWEYENYSIIDSKSMGGSMSNSFVDSREDIKDLLEAIPVAMQKKVLKFFNDYFQALNEISRVTKKYIVMTLGHRIVGGKQIELTDITVKALKQRGFDMELKLEREIFSKRTPRILAYKDGKPISSMNKEYVIIMKKV